MSLIKDGDHCIVDRRLAEGTVSTQSKAVGSSIDASTVSLNECGVELDNFAAIVSLPGSVNTVQVGNDVKELGMSRVEAPGLEEDTAFGPRNSSGPREDVCNSLTSKHCVDLYLVGGKTDWHGTSSGQLSMWHCDVGKNRSS